tara:strand:+ start:412 stop:1344 length:933 start_codon:yes stop_codon:yes gene_type:complete
MAGILDGKQRVMDTIITVEGRRQVAEGDLRIKYATFTDRHTFYQSSGSDGVAEDASDRLYFEATNLLQDQIVIETDDNARMLAYRGGKVEARGNRVLRSNSGKYMEPVTGSAVVGAVDEILQDSSDSFANQYIISTKEPFSDTQGFEFRPDNKTFRITDTHPFGPREVKEASVDSIESLFQDARLSHLPNFRYLPPVNKSGIGRDKGSQLGYYSRLNQNENITFQDLNRWLRKKERVVVKFNETSRDNNIIGQMLEASPDGMNKLSIIDFGEFPDEEPLSPGKRVYFVGKIFIDSNGSHTFVNMFTIVFD